MNIFRYVKKNGEIQLAVLTDEKQVFDLPKPDFQALWYSAKQEKKQCMHGFKIGFDIHFLFKKSSSNCRSLYRL